MQLPFECERERGVAIYGVGMSDVECEEMDVDSDGRATEESYRGLRRFGEMCCICKGSCSRVQGSRPFVWRIILWRSFVFRSDCIRTQYRTPVWRWFMVRKTSHYIIVRRHKNSYTNATNALNISRYLQETPNQCMWIFKYHKINDQAVSIISLWSYSLHNDEQSPKSRHPNGCWQEM
jgi:hypothetical protein